MNIQKIVSEIDPNHYPYILGSVVAAVVLLLTMKMLKKPKQHGKFGNKSTAKQVVDGCGDGQYLSGKTAVVTGNTQLDYILENYLMVLFFLFQGATLVLAWSCARPC